MVFRPLLPTSSLQNRPQEERNLELEQVEEPVEQEEELVRQEEEAEEVVVEGEEREVYQDLI